MECLEEDSGIGEEYYLAAKRVISLESSLEAEVYTVAADRVIDVLEGKTSVSQLRKRVRQASLLDRESTVDDLAGQIDLVEATARRVMHKSTRLALGQVKTETRTAITRAAFARTKASADAQVAQENIARLRAIRTESLVQYMITKART